MYGNIGKPRSKFGVFLDKNGIRQGDVAREAKVNKDTVTKACSPKGDELRGITKKALAEAARKLSGKPVYADDFW